MHLENHLHLLLELNSLGKEKESLNYCRKGLYSVYWCLFCDKKNYKFYCFSQDQMVLTLILLSL